VGASGPAQPPETNFAAPRSRPAFDAASRRTSSATRTPAELAREGVPLVIVQRQLGHSNLGITSVYLQGIDNAEIIETVHARRAPMLPVSTSPRL
jgi:integrase